MTSTRQGWREALAPYLERAPLGALLLGLSSGFPLAMLLSTMTSRLSDSGIDKKTVTAFTLVVLFYNVKFLWAPLIDRVRIPLLATAVGQRRAWLFLIAGGVAAAMLWLASINPETDLALLAAAALTVAFLGATFDIIIDAFRIDHLEEGQLGAGSGMANYGYRLGSAGAGALALIVAERAGWNAGYAAATIFAIPAVIAGLMLGEPVRREAMLAAEPPRPFAERVKTAFLAPLADFLQRPGAWLVLVFIIVHKLGDTMANLSLRLLLADLGFSKDAIAFYDVTLGLIAFLVGIFVGGLVYARLGMMRAVMLGLILMAVSNLGFAALALAGPSNLALALTVGFENFASGAGGVGIVAYLSWLCNLRVTATQFALLSAMASILGRFVSGTTAGALIEAMGFFNFYVLTTVLALPGVLLFRILMQRDRVSADPAPAAG